MPDFHTQMLQVRGNCLVQWYRPEYDWNSKFNRNRIMLQNFKGTKTYSGMITKTSAKRIRTAVELLLQVSPARTVTNPYTKNVITHRLSFITLTIPATKHNYTPNEGYRLLLKQFLRYFRENGIMTTYIWKAEFQQRGQLHYHITTNATIDFRIIRKYWNGLMIKNKMLEEYYNEHLHYDPNSIDIHQVHQLKDIQSYLIKYLSKDDQNQTETKGKIWGCSDNIKGKNLYSVELNKANAHKIMKAYNNNTITIKDLEMCSIISCETINPKTLLNKQQLEDLNNYLVNIRDNIKAK